MEKGDKPSRIYWGLFMSFSIAVGLATAVGTVFDWLLIAEGVPRLGLLVLSNLLAGILLGFLYMQRRVREIEEQRLTKERLAKIAEMNHHIRNALQVVVFYTKGGDKAIAVETINEAVHRIEWTLREILPRGWNLHEGLAKAQPISIRIDPSCNN